MPRPVICRRIGHRPIAGYFKPAGIPLSALQEVTLTLDELEALRLADLEGLYHEQASDRMAISRQTFGNILESARRKTAECLVNGRALRIHGGRYQMNEHMNERHFICSGCQLEWAVPHGTGRPQACPKCASPDLHRSPVERGCGRGPGGGRCGFRGGVRP
jgi:predicted DNA-binding protein (UPF0251 family)